MAGSWFDDANWAGNGKPNAETNIAITKTVLVDREGAVARNVTVKSGGTLDLINGTLSARSLTVDAQGTLRLSGMASLLQVQSLILREGAGIEWDGGTVEVDGGQYSQADLDLLVGSGTLRLIEGATAVIERNVFIGLTANAVGVLEVDGADTALVAGGTLFIGVDGNGILSVTDGGLIVAPDLFIGQMGQVLGNGDLTLSLVNDGLLQPTGVLSIDGSYVQSDLGALAIQLSDIGADLLEVSAVSPDQRHPGGDAARRLRAAGRRPVRNPHRRGGGRTVRHDRGTGRRQLVGDLRNRRGDGRGGSDHLGRPQLGPAQWSVNP